MAEFTEREDGHDRKASHRRKARTMALFLTNPEVAKLVTVEDAIEVLEPTFADLGAGRLSSRLRTLNYTGHYVGSLQVGELDDLTHETPTPSPRAPREPATIWHMKTGEAPADKSSWSTCSAPRRISGG